MQSSLATGLAPLLQLELAYAMRYPAAHSTSALRFSISLFQQRNFLDSRRG